MAPSQASSAASARAITPPPVHRNVPALIAVAIGALVGSILRTVATEVWGTNTGVMVCNIVGCLVLGALTPVMASTSHWRRLVCTGLLGTLTTYSSLVVLTLDKSAGWGYLLGTLVGGLSAAVVGLVAGFEIVRARAIHEDKRNEVNRGAEDSADSADSADSTGEGR
ncbi:chromosome condensation protein CrcB [Corynebacterium falsenii DSM 44353]|uniref:fluoride efflux transporter FluC n=1 Tax=Corynebacterium falsenii TaxID=108486 RepID=UPI0003E96600|nr:CrcB family protein [Corynebacterium falsenii]AHI03945.1 chromosome condensation protein CrcB [Corynebacterium falsenii DSM 44353]UBI04724.1 CrcB family protein [Corynebacterium falsenii]